MNSNLLNQPGHINLNNNVGKRIYDLVLNNDIKTIVDVGTWNGLGSTMCVLQALYDKNAVDTQLYTVELYPDMHQIAKQNLEPYINNTNNKLTLLLGTIIDFNDVYWFDHSSLNFVQDMHAQLWYHKDMYLLKNATNIFNQLPEQIDLLILDGGEYSTYPEWQKLKNRIKFFALDDTNILKCSKIKQEILSSNNYTILYDVTDDRNGYMIGYKNAI